MRWKLALGALTASWGFIAVLVAAVDLGAEPLAFWRLALAAGHLALGALLVGRPALLSPRGRLPALALLGAVQGVHWLLFFETVKHGSVALAVLTFYAAPLLLAVAAPLVLPERWSAAVLAAATVGGVGIALIALGGEDGSASAWAVAAGLGSAATYAALVVLSKRLLLADTPPLTVAFWDCFVGALVVAPVLLLADRVLPADAAEWGAILALGIVLTGVSTLVYVAVAAPRLGAGRRRPDLPRARRGRAPRLGAGLGGARPVDARGRRARARRRARGGAPGAVRDAGCGRAGRDRIVPVSADPARTPPDRNLALELVRVTEAAAMGASRWIGRGDKNAADQAAVDLMRLMVNTVSMRGVVVIGEGEKDEAPMLFNGEEIGDGDGPEVDVAVDPLEGTRLTALGIPGAISVIAVAERGSMFFPGAAVYMDKIAVGPEAADAIDIERSPTENVERIAKAKGVATNDLTIVVLERDRHDDLIAELRASGARVRLIRDGDVAPSIAAAQDFTGIDALMGIGGTPEGVISAAAIKCLGGALQGRLWPRSDEERCRARRRRLRRGCNP